MFVEKIEKIEIEIIKVEINIIWLIYNFDIFFSFIHFPWIRDAVKKTPT